MAIVEVWQKSDTIRNHAAFIWSVADLLRGDYKQSEYGRVILPMVVLDRRGRARARPEPPCDCGAGVEAMTIRQPRP